MSMKINEARTTVTASAIGSYFGVGYLTPLQQWKQDSEGGEVEISEEQENRMQLGKSLENGTLDYFETILKAKITNRNEAKVDIFDGVMRGIIDGMTIYNGEQVVVECKVSNSDSSPENNLGYVMQCQCYMAFYGLSKALLLGLHKGKPFMKVICRDNKMIEQIKDMATFVFNCLNGLDDFSNYHNHLPEEYNKNENAEVTDLMDEDKAKLVQLKYLTESLNDTQAKVDALKDYFKDKYSSLKYKGDGVSITVSEASPRATLNKVKLMSEHQNINLDDYMEVNNNSKIKTCRVTIK